MFSIAGIDLLEQELLDHERTLLEILLQDKTTKKNIIWATDDYAELGEPYRFKKEILPELVTGEQDSLIQPRVEKALEHQTNRTRDKAEVFTPPVGSATHRTIWWMSSGLAGRMFSTSRRRCRGKQRLTKSLSRTTVSTHGRNMWMHSGWKSPAARLPIW